jgi:hypothetical protein
MNHAFAGQFRLMVEISWRADRARSLAALVTASGQMIAAPLIAWTVQRLVDGVVVRDRRRRCWGRCCWSASPPAAG